MTSLDLLRSLTNGSKYASYEELHRSVATDLKKSRMVCSSDMLVAYLGALPAENLKEALIAEITENGLTFGQRDTITAAADRAMKEVVSQ